MAIEPANILKLPGVVPTAVLLVLFTALYFYFLPKPLPGIPYNEESAKRVMGDVPKFLELAKAHRRPREFWAELCSKKNSAITQYFPGPFMKPVVVVSDFREAQDLFIRRHKSFDRGIIGKQMFGGIGDHHFVALETTDPIYPDARFLAKDLMNPGYLSKVSLR